MPLPNFPMAEAAPSPVDVKICGLREERDVEAAFQNGATYGGIIFYPPSPRSVSLDRARELLRAFPVGSRVAVDVEPTPERLEQYGDLGFDFFQIHARTETHLAALAAWSGTVSSEKLWIAPRIPPGESFPQVVLNFADTVLVDTVREGKAGGTGETGDWPAFARWSTQYPHKNWVLAGGLSPENVAEAIRATGAERIDVNSGVESAPGRKDPERIAQLFATLRAEGLLR
jgi:phosphoribosylanthranilate isomerase